MPWGVAIAGAASVAGSYLSSSKQSKAVERGQDQAQAQYQQAREDLSPWRTQGQNALLRTADLNGLNGAEARKAAMADFQSDPGYQFQMAEGLRAIDKGAAAKGLLSTATTLKAEQAYGQGLANQSFGTYYNRLLGLSQQGQSAAAGQANVAGQMAQTDASAATAQANIYGQQGQAMQQGIQNAYSIYAQQNQPSSNRPASISR